jgi:hypothetical protein
VLSIPRLFFTFVLSAIQHFPMVQIRTGKYLNWFIFLPQNIFEQFARAANLFYLLLSIISAIPGVRRSAR